MRQRIMVGLLVILVGAIGWAGYTGWRDSQAAQADAAPDRLEPAVLGTIHVDLDSHLLARLDKESPRLTLEADDGTRVIVSVWRARGDLAMTQFVGLQPAHYRTLLIDWGGGDQQMVTIDVNLAALKLD